MQLVRRETALSWAQANGFAEVTPSGRAGFKAFDVAEVGERVQWSRFNSIVTNETVLGGNARYGFSVALDADTGVLAVWNEDLLRVWQIEQRGASWALSPEECVDIARKMAKRSGAQCQDWW